MAASLRDLRRKIRSIRGTQKITSAMQLVAASRMQRATRRAIDSRPYASELTGLIGSIAPTVDLSSQPLFHKRSITSVTLLLVTTNRGLAGSLNTQLLREYSRWQNEQVALGREVRVVSVGAKGRAYVLRYAKDRLLADFTAPDTVPAYRDITPFVQLLEEEFISGRTDAVYLGYNHFISTLRQEPRILPFLPFRAESEGGEEQRVKSKENTDVIFEPSKDVILTALVPRMLRVQMYQIMLETQASEHSARMIAMKNATDNAGDLISDLQLTYNSLRQAAITGELLDIAAGAAALTSS